MLDTASHNPAASAALYATQIAETFCPWPFISSVESQSVETVAPMDTLLSRVTDPITGTLYLTPRNKENL